MPAKYTKVKVIKITETQHQTLQKLATYKINVARFIRDAIAEKLNRDQPKPPRKQKINCPFKKRKQCK